MERPFYAHLAAGVAAFIRSDPNGPTPFPNAHADWENRITRAVANLMPSGSGFDNGTQLDMNASRADRLVFRVSFHHMNDAGFYDGWTDHAITVRPDLSNGFTLTVGGRNRRDIKSYIGECFDAALRQPFDWPDARPHDFISPDDWAAMARAAGWRNSVRADESGQYVTRWAHNGVTIPLPARDVAETAVQAVAATIDAGRLVNGGILA